MTKDQTPPTPALVLLAVGKGWIAIDKPAGMSVHNDPQSAIARLEAHLKSDANLARQSCWQGKDFLPAPAHRLDRETSGVLLLSTRRDSAVALQTAFAKNAGDDLYDDSWDDSWASEEERAANQAGRMEKIYRAVLRGDLTRKNAAASGVWDLPLSDRAEGRKQPAGASAERKPCRTRYQLSRHNQYFTEITIRLETGRQHQIRRHAVLAGHQVLNDERYGDARHKSLIARIYHVDRLMLHAESLRLPKSLGGQTIKANLPNEFDQLFAEQIGAS